MTLQTPTQAGTCCGCIADGTTILGTGIPGDPFRAAPVGGLNTQNFIYTVTGAEVGFGTATIRVNLPAARPDTNYTAIASDGGKVNGNQTLYTAPQSGYLVGSVQVVCGAIAAIGDKIILLVQERTS